MPRRKTSKPKQAPKKAQVEEMEMETSEPEIFTTTASTTKSRRKPISRKKSFSSDSDLELPFNSPISKLELLKPELSTRTPSKYDTLENTYNRNIMNTPEFNNLRMSRRSLGGLRRQDFDSMDLQSMKASLTKNSNVWIPNPFTIVNYIKAIIRSFSGFFSCAVRSTINRVNSHKELIKRAIYCVLLTVLSFFLASLIYKKYNQRLKKPLFTDLEIDGNNKDINFEQYLSPYKEAIKKLESLNYDLLDKIEKQNKVISKMNTELSKINILETAEQKVDKHLKKLEKDLLSTQQMDKRLGKQVDEVNARVVELESEKNQRNKLSTDKDILRNLKALQEDVETNRKNLNFLNKKIDMSKYGDMTLKYDFAHFQHGGRVIGFNALHFVGNKALNWITKLLVMVLNLQRRVKNKVINETVDVKGCTPLEMGNAFVIIQMAEEVRIKSISYEHLDQHVVVDSTAIPKILRIYGLETSGEEVFLGEINYDREIKHLIKGMELFEDIKGYIQDVEVNETNKYRRVKVKVTQNYGNTDYVCLYRIRVHDK